MRNRFSAAAQTIVSSAFYCGFGYEDGFKQQAIGKKTGKKPGKETPIAA
jgi:hypothetical protein